MSYDVFGQKSEYDQEGSAVCLTRNPAAAGSSLTDVTAL